MTDTDGISTTMIFKTFVVLDEAGRFTKTDLKG